MRDEKAYKGKYIETKLLMSDDERTKSGETPPPRRARNTILSRAHGHPRDRENSTEKPSRRETSIARYEFTRIERVHPLSCPHLAREKNVSEPHFSLPAEKPRHFFAHVKRKGVKISAQIHVARDILANDSIFKSYKTYLGDRVFKIGRLDAGLFHNLRARHLFCAML